MRSGFAEVTRRLGALAGAVLVLLPPPPALAQSQNNTAEGSIPNPPDIDLLDDQSVQADAGYISVSVPDVAIGGGAGLAHSVANDPVANTASGTGGRYSGFYPGYPAISSYVGGILQPSQNFSNPDSTTTFSFGGVSERFDGNVTAGANPGASLSGDGGQLVKNANGTFTYTDKQGAVYSISSLYGPNSNISHPVTQVLYPDGSWIKIHYRAVGNHSRVQGVEKSNGFFLKYLYPSSTSREFNEIVAGNLAYEYCDLTADTCALAMSWPRSQMYFSANNSKYHVIDMVGRETRFTLNSVYEIVAIKPATSTVDTVTYEMCSRTYPGPCAIMNTYGSPYPLNVTTITYPGMVFAATANGVRVPYGFQPAAGGHYNVVYSDHPYRGRTEVLSTYNVYTPLYTGNLQKVTLPTLTAYYNSQLTNRLNSVARAGSITEEYSWDARRNMLEKRILPKSGDSSAPLVTTVEYDSTCANIVICNKPKATIDAKLARTEYSYDPVHGGLVRITGPAVNGVQPQTRFEYVQRRAWRKSASGSYVASAPTWVLAKESFCRTSAATGNASSPCQVAGDEVVTTYEYGPDSGPNNLLVRGVAMTADGQTLRTCYGYDRFGNKISETAPNAALAVCP